MWFKTSVVVLAIVLVGGGAACPQKGLGGEPPAVVTVRVEDIGEIVRVLGTLGAPLREVLSVHGTWVELSDGPEKPGSTLWFRVTEVNGWRLAKPVGFRQLDVKVIERGGKLVEGVSGERWELRAYETWPDYSPPLDFVKELGQAPSAPPARGPARIVGLLKLRNDK